MNKARGQTALILILLTAAALIFLAISLNWGRVSQTKILLSTSAYESASLLSSEAASYGEMEKENYLSDKNSHTGMAAWLLAIFAVILAVVCIIAAPFTAGASLTGFALVVAILAVAMAVVNLVLQIVVVGPMITNLWNKAQKNQPVQQQFFEQGIGTALQGTVTDQAVITDYFDANANGVFGNTAVGFPNDTITRFAFFYGERQKMIAQPLNPQLIFFYNNLASLINGGPVPGGTPYNPHLNATCVDTNPYLADGVTINPSYNPYCDPCCQPSQILDPDYCPPSTPACTSSTTTNCCNFNPLHPTQYKSIRPTNCPTDTSANGAPQQCWFNNPYNTYPAIPATGTTPYIPGSNDSPYTLLYDPSYQDYFGSSLQIPGSLSSDPSILGWIGRDEQEFPFYSINKGGIYPYMTPKGSIFPYGIFQFFWVMKDYSPEVDEINVGNNGPASLLPSQWHWCVPNTSQGSAGPAPDLNTDPADKELPWPGDPQSTNTYPPSQFPYLAQLGLGYFCSGADCCINPLANWMGGRAGGTAISQGPSFCPDGSSTGWTIDEVQNASLPGNVYLGNGTNPSANPALDVSFGEGAVAGAESSQCSGTATGNTTNVCSWMEGDDQLCSYPPPSSPQQWNWPYNENLVIPNLPDGICEWTGPYVPPTTDSASTIASSLPSGPPFSLTWPSNKTPVTPPPGFSSVDALDDAMHTLSDFNTFANGDFLGQPIGVLNSTFDTWYPQMATWIAPECSPANAACDADVALDCAQDPTLQECQTESTACKDHTCNPGSNGRLLSLYAPASYPSLPSIAGVSLSNTAPTTVDEFGYWNNNVIIPWQENDYTGSATTWCLPPAGTMTSPPQDTASGIPPVVNPAATPGTTDIYENTWTANNSTGGKQEMYDILACMNYNDSSGVLHEPQIGPITFVVPGGAVYSYSKCLAALTGPQMNASGNPIAGTNGCTDSTGAALLYPPLPKACQPFYLGRDLLYGNAPPFIGTGTQVVPTQSCVCGAGGCGDGTPQGTVCTSTGGTGTGTGGGTGGGTGTGTGGAPGGGGPSGGYLVSSCQEPPYEVFPPFPTQCGPTASFVDVPDNSCPSSDACTATNNCEDVYCTPTVPTGGPPTSGGGTTAQSTCGTAGLWCPNGGTLICGQCYPQTDPQCTSYGAPCCDNDGCTAGSGGTGTGTGGGSTTPTCGCTNPGCTPPPVGSGSWPACTCYTPPSGGAAPTCATATLPENPTQTTVFDTSTTCTDSNNCQCVNDQTTSEYDGGGCNAGIPGGYAAWVQNSLTLFQDEAQKFDLREQYLKNIAEQAMSMQATFTQTETDLKQFLAPCNGDPTCSGGGPAAQLMYARSLPNLGTQPVPNAVIYGWIDKTLANGQTLPAANGNPGGTGYAHIVKVTAYAPGRNINPTGGNATFIQGLLPWIKTYSHILTRTYELTNRDGYVYVSIKRWDEDHSNPVNYPNGHLLWQTLSHNPAAQVDTSGVHIGNGSLGPCAALYPAGSSDTFGWGLEPLTAMGLQAPYVNFSSADNTTLAQAFMLNDEGDGKIDASVGNGTACSLQANSSTPYCQCMYQVNQLLATAPESHACLDYIASTDATKSNTAAPQNTNSGGNDRDYTMKFVDCSTIAGYPPPDDLTAPPPANQTTGNSN